ncbi:uncharacterized protein LOC141897615 [Acropora palmata]|uniref:uncharacterized protein LOC141897615 n=1 Tax=Acropora palmata TaxID=6131 RepID=UPI003D9FD72F
MEVPGIPEKRRKLNEIDVEPGLKSSQSQTLTLEELKRNGPRVLVNRLNKELIDKLRRATVEDGEKVMAKSTKPAMSTESRIEEANPSVNRRERALEDKEMQEAGDKDEIKQAFTSIKSGLLSFKCGNVQGNRETNYLTAIDTQTFRQIVREVIQQRTKLIEDAVLANVVKLQHRIRDLERENKELHWNAKRLTDLLRKHIPDVAKRTLPNQTSRGIQVEMNQGSEIISSSPVVSPPEPKDSYSVTTTDTEVAPFKPSSRSNSANTRRTDELANLLTNQQPSHLSQATRTPASTAAEAGAVAQVNSSLENGQNYKKASQLRVLLQEQRQQEHKQQGLSKLSSPSVKEFQMSLGRTAESLLQQLQLQQQIQDELQYPFESQEQKCQGGDSVHLFDQLRQEQITRPPDSSPLPLSHELHQQSVTPSPSDFQPSQSKSFLQKLLLPAVDSLEQSKQSKPQENVIPSPTPLACSTATNLSIVSKHSDAKLIVSNGQIRNQVIPHLTDGKEESSSKVELRSSKEDFHNDAPLPSSAQSIQLSTPVQPVNGGQESVILQQKGIVSNANAGTFSSAHKDDSSSATEHQNLLLRQDPSSIKNTHRSILVRTRRRQKVEDVLPIGFRFSLPSPEYFLQKKLWERQTQQQIQDHESQAGLESQDQPPKTSISLHERLITARQSHTPTREVHSRQINNTERQIVSANTALKDTNCNKKFRNNELSQVGNPATPPPVENVSSEEDPQKRQIQYERRPLLVKVNQDQQKDHAKASKLESNLHSLQSRQPIQSPGVSSSALSSKKYISDSQRTVTPPELADTRPGPANSTVISTNQTTSVFHLPKPSASIAVISNGIVLSWNMAYNDKLIKIDNYELFACQDVAESDGHPVKWKKIGIVKALPLPMACTLSQFSSGNKYFFSVRAVDERERAGPFSDPCTVSLSKNA